MSSAEFDLSDSVVGKSTSVSTQERESTQSVHVQVKERRTLVTIRKRASRSGTRKSRKGSTKLKITDGKMNVVQIAANKFLSKIGRSLTIRSELEIPSAEVGAAQPGPQGIASYETDVTDFCEIPNTQKRWLVRQKHDLVASSVSRAMDFFFYDFTKAKREEWEISPPDTLSDSACPSPTTLSSDAILTAVSLHGIGSPTTGRSEIRPIDIPSDVILEPEPPSPPCEDSSALESDLKLTDDQEHLAPSRSPKQDFLHPDVPPASPPRSSPPLTPDYLSINLPPGSDIGSMSPMSSTSSSSSDGSIASASDYSPPLSSAASTTSVLPAEESKSAEFIKLVLASSKFKKLKKEQNVREPLKVSEMKPIFLNGVDVTPRILSVYEHGWSQKGRAVIPNSQETLYLYNRRMRNLVDNLPTFPLWTRLYLKPPMKDWHSKVPHPTIKFDKAQIDYSRKCIVLIRSETFWLLDRPCTLFPESSAECEIVKAKNARVELARYNRSIGLFPKHKCWQTAAVQSVGHLKEKQIQTETVHFKDKCVMTSPFLIDEAYNEQPEKPDHSYRAFMLYYKKKFENSSKFFNYLRLYPDRLYNFLTMCNRMERYLKYNHYWDIIARFEGMGRGRCLKSDVESPQQSDEDLPTWARKKRVIANEPVPYFEHVFTISDDSVKNNYSVSAMVFSTTSPDILVVGYRPFEPVIEQPPGSESESESSGSGSESESELRKHLYGEDNFPPDLSENSDQLELLFNLEEFETSKPPHLPPPGLIYCWTIKNCDRPERVFHANGGISNLSFSKARPYLLAAGTTEGTICFYDVREFQPNPISTSGFTLCKGSSVQIGWSTLNLPTRIPREVILAVTENGYFLRFFPEKKFPGTLIKRIGNIMFRDRDYKTNEVIPQTSYILCTSFAVNSQNDSVVIMGSREGLVYQCSDQSDVHGFDKMYVCHGSVREVSWSTLTPDLFLSCGDDAYLRIWQKNKETPNAEIMTVTERAVVSADWSQLSPKVVVLITENRIELWNIHWVYTPITFHEVDLEAKFTRVRFNPRSWSVAVGDDLGNIHLYEVKDMYPDF